VAFGEDVAAEVAALRVGCGWCRLLHGGYPPYLGPKVFLLKVLGLAGPCGLKRVLKKADLPPWKEDPGLKPTDSMGLIRGVETPR
jgi:hypothetical protein